MVTVLTAAALPRGSVVDLTLCLVPFGADARSPHAVRPGWIMLTSVLLEFLPYVLDMVPTSSIVSHDSLGLAPQHPALVGVPDHLQFQQALLLGQQPGSTLAVSIHNPTSQTSDNGSRLLSQNSKHTLKGTPSSSLRLSCRRLSGAARSVSSSTLDQIKGARSAGCGSTVCFLACLVITRGHLTEPCILCALTRRRRRLALLL